MFRTRRLLLVALLAMSWRSLSSFAHAQNVAIEGQAVFGTVNGAFFALSVSDLEASARWYADKLGLHRVMTVPRTGTIAGVVALEGPGIIVELIQHDDAQSAGRPLPELTYGIAKAGIVVADFDGTVARLRARGIAFMGGPYPARKEARANVMFRDNAGNVIQVFGPYAAR